MNAWLAQYRGYVFLTLVFVIALGGVLYVARRPDPKPIEIITPPPRATATERPSPTAVILIVQVSGAVANPGVYHLSDGSRVDDAVRAAGGATADADLTGVNLARKIVDGEMIVVPKIGDPAAAPSATAAGRARATTTPAAPLLININTASAGELDRLPGIGPALAQRIIDYREANGPFQKIEDIMKVRGIGQAVFDTLKNLIVVQ